MTEAPRDGLKDRVLDLIFGRRSTPEELAFALAAAPPSKIAKPLRIAEWALACLMLIAFLWQYGWLPFVNSKLDSWWFMGVWAIVISLRFVRELIEKHYERRAKARMTPTS